jgi:hypothetical protein
VWGHLADTLAPWGVTLPVQLHHLPTSERWRIAARSALMAAGADLGRPLLVAHPGAGARWKEAPSARFARALESMAADGGFEVVVHQGPADAVVLSLRVDDDRADPCDHAALVDERASEQVSCTERPG